MRKENRISSKKRKGYRDEKAALIILLIWIFLAVCVPLFGPYSPTEQNAEIRNQPMSLIHFFGTDEFGRDNFTRVWYGAGISLVIGVGSSLINGMIGILYGAVAGYRGKRIDMILMRAADVIAAIPSILYVILITLVMGPGIKSMIFGICIAGWIDMARVVRGEMIRLKETDFAAAAKIDGISGTSASERTGDDSRKLLVSDTAGDFYRSIFKLFGGGIICADGKSRNIDTGRTRQDDSLSV